MAEMDFGRQLKPVYTHVIGGEDIDRSYWAGKLNGYLQHQPCATARTTNPTIEIIYLSPDANND